ncbi:hypothetical protein AAMO2058_000367100 [Amorphochlora amoebiformis]|mmetsp:Transcript_16355/g.25908  ORF Transcript_16355/g.25908 Transcript_16355/m.25908 type:complete len:313 (-) Transcript_16355:65-1003(-)
MAFVLLSSALLLSRNAVAVSLSRSSTPVFFWSGSSQFEGHLTISEPLKAGDIEGYARDIVTKSSKEQLLNPDRVSVSTPEILLLVTFSQASNKFMSMFAGSHLKSTSVLENIISNSKSSLIAPRVSLDDKYQTFSSMFSTHLPSKGHRIELEIDGADCDKALRTIVAKESLVSNDRTDLVSITFLHPEKQSTENCLRRIDSKISELTSKNYVTMLAAEKVDPIQLDFATPKGKHHSSVSSKLNHKVFTQATTTPTTTVVGEGLIEYITPQIFIGILLMLMLLSFLYMGVMAMSSVVVPMRFQKTKFKIGKIY